LIVGGAPCRRPSAWHFLQCDEGKLRSGGDGLSIFYLHIRDGELLLADVEGQEFPDVEAAHAEAVRSAREMLAEKIKLGEIVDGQKIEIVDEAGDVVGVVALKETFRAA
jgi:hypothetical protein